MILNAWKNMKKWGFLVAAVLGVVAIGYYICLPMVYKYTSDYADTLCWTQAMFDSGKLFNPDFTYAASLPFGGQWFYAPFYLMFGFSITTQICGQIFFLLCFCACLVFLTRSLKFTWPWVWTSLLCVLGVLCTCEKMREVYFAHILYYGLGSLFLMLSVSLMLRAEEHFKNDKGTVYLILLGIFMLLCNTNGIPTLSTCTIPVLCAFFIVTLLETKSLKRNSHDFSTLISIIFCAGMSLVGLFLGKILIGDNAAGYQGAFSVIAASGNWGENISNLIASYFENFTGTIYKSIAFVSAAGIDTLMRMGLALALAILPVCALFSITKIKSRGVRIFILSHFILTIIISIGFAFGNINNAQWRLSPTIVSGTLVSVMYLRHLWSTKDLPKRIGGFCSFVAIAICLLLCFETLALPAKNIYSGNEYELAGKLKEDGYTYGYASFWNAGAVTALTNNQVKIRNVALEEDGRISPDYYQSNLKWYGGQSSDEKFVLVLTSSEYSQLSDIYNAYIEKEEPWKDYYIIALKQNIF